MCHGVGSCFSSWAWTCLGSCSLSSWSWFSFDLVTWCSQSVGFLYFTQLYINSAKKFLVSLCRSKCIFYWCLLISIESIDDLLMIFIDSITFYWFYWLLLIVQQSFLFHFVVQNVLSGHNMTTDCMNLSNFT